MGLFPFRSRLTEERLAAGYATVHVRPNCRLFPPGAALRCHFTQVVDVVEERPVQGLAAMINPSPSSFEVSVRATRCGCRIVIALHLLEAPSCLLFRPTMINPSPSSFEVRVRATCCGCKIAIF